MKNTKKTIAQKSLNYLENVDIKPLGSVIIVDLPFGNYSMNTFKHSIKNM